jgi:hypothetical protein
VVQLYLYDNWPILLKFWHNDHMHIIKLQYSKHMVVFF